MKKRLCESCKNNFVLKTRQYLEENYFDEKRWIDILTNCPVSLDNVDIEKLIVQRGNEFCVYTHEYEFARECSFYNRKSKLSELEIQKIEQDCVDSRIRETLHNTTTSRISLVTGREKPYTNREGGGSCANPYWGTGEKGDANPDTQKEKTIQQMDEEKLNN